MLWPLNLMVASPVDTIRKSVSEIDIEVLFSTLNGMLLPQPFFEDLVRQK